MDRSKFFYSLLLRYIVSKGGNGDQKAIIATEFVYICYV